MDESEQRSSPLAGPGTTRANRRLQLRKNGFRGRVLPNRNITPKRRISDAWSLPAQQDDTATSDLPQQPDSNKAYLSARGRSSSILQEVSNSSLRRKDKNKNKHDSVLSVFADENGDDKPWNFESLPPEAPNLTKPRQKHQRTQSYKSNPDSDQQDQHIAYLESELAAYQTQLASLNSPSVTKEKGQKIRQLNQDIRRLEQENSRWETEFDERVLQVMEEHDGIENNLRAKINMLEADGEKYLQKVKELQAQLDATKKALDTAEAANIEFEKRLETFAHLLVTSPIKTETPLAQPPFTKESRSIRQKRLSFHRFPTAGSLHQASMLEQQEVDEARPHSEGAVQDYFDNHVSDTEWEASKRESFVSDASRNSIDFSLLMNQEPPPSSSRARPNRRMRRFHGGSHLPKPLILSAAQLAPILASAPVYEPHDSPRAFPFPEVYVAPRRASCHEFSPITGRRRAKTNTDGVELLTRPSFTTTDSSSSIPSTEEDKTPTPQHANASHTTSAEYPSIGPNTGRNLLEELHAARHDDDSQTTSSGPTPFATLNAKPTDLSSTSHSTSIQRNVSGALRLRHQRSISEATGLSLYPPPSRTASSTYPSPAQKSTGLVEIVKELLRQPFKIARRCVARAHQALLLSRTLNRFQWMLLHALLGPLATRRLMACSLHENAILMQAPYRPSSASPASEKETAFQDEDSDSEAETSDVELSPCPSRQSRHRASPSRCVFNTQRKVQKKKSLQRSSNEGPRTQRLKRDDTAPMLSRHSPWLWVRFSLTLAFAVAAAVREGPGALMVECERHDAKGGDGGEDEVEAQKCGCLKCLGREMAGCA
ncbi:hypothetical protein E4T44_03014 [Aureobasidium sp. EXF-8845]|nr:hypothetical protein E4T44_03014 [Aureobasidium sp. EXF-8845]KAI4855570.1 hypothetical protein E4T45_02987 [Aureobasidium sp. EXF-8846]